MSHKEFITEAIKESEKRFEPHRDREGEKKMRKDILNYQKEVSQKIPEYMEEEQRKRKLFPEIDRKLV